MNPRRLAPFVAAVGISVPGICLHLLPVSLPPPAVALVAGAAIMGAAFVLLWACDAAQADISQALAVAIVALIAVSPEYAVDMYFTWMAGKHPQGDYAQYAIANMTGANRLLIGVAWALIAFLHWVKTRRAVRLGAERRTELMFLALATAYAFLIPIKGSLTWFDGFVFLSIYAWYIVLTSRRPATDVEVHGPAELLLALPTARRRAATWSLFAFAGIAILANAEAFSEGLIGTGEMLRVNKFLLVQWLAPLASEAPEFIVAIMFVLRGNAALALGSLLCAKLNQWTLLVGMIPGVYAVSHGSLQHAIPMNAIQLHEILLTAAQSLLAVLMMANLRLTVGNALLLFALFIGQLVSPVFIAANPATFPWTMNGDEIHKLYTLMYIVASATILFCEPARLRRLREDLRSAQLAPRVGEDSALVAVRAASEGDSPNGRRCSASHHLPPVQRRSVCGSCAFRGRVCAGG